MNNNIVTNLSNCGTQAYTVPAKTRETGRDGTQQDCSINRTASEELTCLSEKYECLKSSDYSVKINHSLLAKAASDEKTSAWLEHNLSLIPDVVDNLKSAAAARGSKVISCHISINGYDSMTTEMVTQSEAEPGTEEAREELGKRVNKMREERKAREKQAAKRSEKKRAEEKPETHTVTITGINAENLIKQIADKAASDVKIPFGSPITITGFDVKA